MVELDTLKALLLCGGQSSRMGCPKHAMPFNGMPIAARLIERIRETFDTGDSIYISLHDRQQTTEAGFQDEALYFLYDNIEDDSVAEESYVGPAAGLLAAHHLHKTARWLVVACDYPLISAADLRQLIDNYEDPLTCFENTQGWPEPLLAIWSPSALQALEQNVRQGLTGPIRTLNSLRTKKLRPADERSLLNTNTPAEWEEALRVADDICAAD